MNILLRSARFVQSYYRKEGSGFPIILVHGFGETGDIFKYQIDYLKQFYCVIVPDLPGSGHSALPTKRMSMELLADFIFEILLQENYEKVMLFGHSMGGYATFAFVEKYPDRLVAFGLIHSSGFADDDIKKENRRKSIKLIENEGKEIFLKAMVPNLYSPQSLGALSHEIDFHLTMALKLSSDTLIAYYSAMIDRPDRTPLFKSNNFPVLFVIGRDDTAINYKDMLFQSAMPNISKIELLENTGHTSMLECPDKLNAILNNFCIYVLANKIA